MRRHPSRLIGDLVLAGVLSLAAGAAAACVGSPGPSSLAQATATPPVVTVEVGTAPGLAARFAPAVASVPAGAEVHLVFRNQSAESHNLSFTGALESVHTRTIVEPGRQETMTFPAPAAGPHPFVCTIHPGMTGDLQVTEAVPRS